MTGEEVIKNTKVLLSKPPSLDDQINKFWWVSCSSAIRRPNMGKQQAVFYVQLGKCQQQWEGWGRAGTDRIGSSSQQSWGQGKKDNSRLVGTEQPAQAGGFGLDLQRSVLRQKNTYNCTGKLPSTSVGVNGDKFPAAHGDLWKRNIKPKSHWLSFCLSPHRTKI